MRSLGSRGRAQGDNARSLRLFIDSSGDINEVFGQVRDNVEQTTHAMTGIAAASSEVAQGAERQALMPSGVASWRPRCRPPRTARRS